MPRNEKLNKVHATAELAVAQFPTEMISDGKRVLLFTATLNMTKIRELCEANPGVSELKVYVPAYSSVSARDAVAEHFGMVAVSQSNGELPQDVRESLKKAEEKAKADAALAATAKLYGMSLEELVGKIRGEAAQPAGTGRGRRGQ